jgi:hypothetical protein
MISEVRQMAALIGEALTALGTITSGSRLLNKNRDHFIWPSNLAAPLPVFDNRSNASRPPAA